MIIKENCEQRGWCHMAYSRKVEKRIKEWGGRHILSYFVFPAKKIRFLERRRTG